MLNCIGHFNKLARGIARQSVDDNYAHLLEGFFAVSSRGES